MTTLTATETRTIIATCAAFMAQMKYLHYFSMLITLCIVLSLLVGLFVVPLSPFALATLVCAFVAGLLEMVYAIRVGFDAALLGNLSNNDCEIESALTHLDSALVSLMLMSNKKIKRDIHQRLSGCIKLVKYQLGFTIVQFISFITFILGHYFLWN